MITVEEQAPAVNSVSAKIQARIDALENETKIFLASAEATAAWLREHVGQIEAIGICPALCGHIIDFDSPTREQVLAIIKAFPGKWNKAPCPLEGFGAMNYTRETVPGEPMVRIYGGPLPPSCHLVRETVIVPEHTETKTRVVCNDGTTLRDNQ